MEGDYLTAREYQALLKWLDGKNHSLLVLGGYDSFGAEGLARRRRWPTCCPSSSPRAPTPQTEKPFTLQLTDKGAGPPDLHASAPTGAEREAVEGGAAARRHAAGAAGQAGRGRAGGQPRGAGRGQAGRGAGRAARRRRRAGDGVLPRHDLEVEPTAAPARARTTRSTASSGARRSAGWPAGRMDDTRPLLTVRTGQPVYEANKQGDGQAWSASAAPGTDLAGSRLRRRGHRPQGRAGRRLTPRVGLGRPGHGDGGVLPDGWRGATRSRPRLKAGGKVLANQAASCWCRAPTWSWPTPAPGRTTCKALKEATGRRLRRRSTRPTSSAEHIPPQSSGGGAAGQAHRVLGFALAVRRASLAAVSGEWFLRRRNHLV